MGVDIVVIDVPILSTTDKSDLEKTLIANIIFELLSYLAEKERIKIKTRQAEGIAVAKLKGIKLVRPNSTIQYGFIEKYANGGRESRPPLTLYEYSVSGGRLFTS